MTKTRKDLFNDNTIEATHSGYHCECCDYQASAIHWSDEIDWLKSEQKIKSHIKTNKHEENLYTYNKARDEATRDRVMRILHEEMYEELIAMKA